MSPSGTASEHPIGPGAASARRPGEASRAPLLTLGAERSFAAQHRHALHDLVSGLRLAQLIAALGWLDIRLRYRGSVLGPFWLTLSTGVMIGALGVLYATLFHMNTRDYLPFLALSIVLWTFAAQLIADACAVFTQNEGLIRSVRMPFTLYAGRNVIRNLLVLAHNIVVILVVFAVTDTWPGAVALMALPGVLLWIVNGFFVSLALGAVCARFRDIPPIVGSVMQIAFYVTPVIWRPEQLGARAVWLPLNPFFSLLEIVRGPLLGVVPRGAVWCSACLASVLAVAAAWLLFVRVRGRLAFWV